MMDASCCRTTNNIGEPRAADPTAAAMNRMRRVSTIMVLPFCWDELILTDKGSRQRNILRTFRSHMLYPAWSTCFCTRAASSFLLCTSSLA